MWALSSRITSTVGFRLSTSQLLRPSFQRIVHSTVPSATKRTKSSGAALITSRHGLQQFTRYSTTSLNAQSRKKTFSVIPQEKIETPYQLVVVESPSKCSTIEKILREYAKAEELPYSFVVTSCLGHVRNLPTKNDKNKDKTTSRFPYPIAGIDLDNQYAPTYEIIPGKEQVVRDLQKLAKNAQKILLATDPDREGEAMAWHLQQVLGESLQFERISFTEITPSAVQHAITNPVSINPGLVQAQETRRILDRLAGFTVSPLLWKKIAPGLTAGRVQSVGMALVVQRERERLMFEPTEYFSIEATFSKGNLTAQLRAVDNVPVALSGKDFASQGQVLTSASAHKLHLKHDNAAEFVKLFQNEETEWKVTEIKATKRQQQPPQPYRTSTLQQDVNRRFGLGVDQCMRTAQQLYENGLISYMRTDSTYISEDAEGSIQQAIVEKYGKDMYQKRTGVSSKYKKNSKFAQEAHEAIRPAIQPDGKFLSPDTLELPKVSKDLYRMIYQRTLASRMPNLVTNLTQITIEAFVNKTTGTFRTSGSVVLSPGYTAAYGALDEGDNNDDDPVKKELPALVEGEILNNTGVTETFHETQPPPRYTEASFVKELEALGVGRPSTYAGIVKILRDRAYVGSPSTRPGKQKKELSGPAISAHRAAGGEDFTGTSKGSLVPSLPAFVVCSLLENHCPTYVDSDFTSQMEDRLDHIANSDSSSEQERLRYLEEFYGGNNGLAFVIKNIDDTVEGEDLRCVELPMLQHIGVHGGEVKEEYDDIRLLVGPWGPYIRGCAKNGAITTAPLPSSMAADLSTITRKNLESILSTKEAGGYLIGIHPEDGRNIRLKSGRFGAYLQCGEDGDSNTTTHSLPKDLPVSDSTAKEHSVPDDYPPNMPILSFDEAIGYVSLPKVVAEIDDKPITAALGPYGPYLKCNGTFVNLDSGKDILTIDEDTAQSLMTEAFATGGKKKPQGTIAELGDMEGSTVRIKSGRFGKYINWKRTNVKLPENFSEDNLPSLEEAWDLVCEKKGAKTAPPKNGPMRREASDGPAVNIPPPPKRPPTAYILFCAENREKFTDQKLSLGETSKALSKMWSDLSEDDKTKFTAEALVRKEQYKQEKEKWGKDCQKLLAGLETTSKQRTRSSSPTIKKPGLRRPKSAYLFFCDEKRAEVSMKTQSLGETSKELAKLWRETSDRSKYERLAADDKTRYEKEKDATRSLPKASRNVNSGLAKKEGKKNKLKRPLSAYMLFCREHRAQVMGEEGEKLPLGETTKRLASMWKSCDSKTKERFEEMARKEKAEMLQSAD